MKVLVVGNEEAVLGFSLVGVHGQAARTDAEANKALDEALKDTEVGIVLVTADVVRLIPARVSQLKMRSSGPLVVEIPGPEGQGPDEPSLREVIQRAVGVKF